LGLLGIDDVAGDVSECEVVLLVVKLSEKIDDLGI